MSLTKSLLHTGASAESRGTNPSEKWVVRREGRGCRKGLVSRKGC